MSHYLTKSKFVRALDCPTKLYYAQHDEYKSTLEDNDFMQALAEGGLQVGELAKLYFPGGHDIPMMQEKSKSLSETKALLQQNDVTIYEAAMQHKNCFVLVDVLQKKGNRLDLIEVKSKSWEPDESFTYKNKDDIYSDWQEYLFDVAFQTWVARRAYPNFQIEPYLMLIDKTQKATVDGLHQYFKIMEENGRSEVKVKDGVNKDDLGAQILRKVHVGEYVEQILEGNGREPEHELEAAGFDHWISTLSEYLKADQKYPITTGNKCKSCEYRITPDKLSGNEKSGFAECWKQDLQWRDDDLAKPHVFDIWNDRRTEKYLDQGVYHMEELIPGMLRANPDKLYKQTEWDYGQRQTVQIMKATGHHSQEEAVLAGLFQEMDSWNFPLHFIDFEAVTPAIPFHKGQKPYKKTPFQFSCHTIYEDGTLEHTAEWIEDTPGKFPCFDFVRELKKCLEGDDGSVFMYHHFENTVLNDVIDLLEERQPDDASELIEWIKTITKGGPREMIDQQRMVVKYYYSPYMGSSNSIKDVLPAVLNESPRLKEIYSQPYNGLSIKDKVLYQTDENSGKVLSPYKLLDPIGFDIPDYETAEETIAEGGTAMMAWSRMQFDDVSPEEREATFKALLKYCELDTLAMVMIHQHWVWLKNS
ncbi:DUF2779 domain-containing protein [Fodinibius saliphilus]|uniref:DUF2779 domain-containing protein n=1 Tax=Fodinibius saliphilus TaxID=1920650 RepID=UPI001109DAA7|nr:DUF2779 domain-containing protein [Fodinibius saliphilus]